LVRHRRALRRSHRAADRPGRRGRRRPRCRARPRRGGAARRRARVGSHREATCATRARSGRDRAHHGRAPRERGGPGGLARVPREAKAVVVAVRRLLYLTGAIVLVDTLFFAALTPLLPHYAHMLGLGKAGAGVLAAAYPAGALVGSIPSGVVAAR